MTCCHNGINSCRPLNVVWDHGCDNWEQNIEGEESMVEPIVSAEPQIIEIDDICLVRRDEYPENRNHLVHVLACHNSSPEYLACEFINTEGCRNLGICEGNVPTGAGRWILMDNLTLKTKGKPRTPEDFAKSAVDAAAKKQNVAVIDGQLFILSASISTLDKELQKFKANVVASAAATVEQRIITYKRKLAELEGRPLMPTIGKDDILRGIQICQSWITNGAIAWLVSGLVYNPTHVTTNYTELPVPILPEFVEKLKTPVIVTIHCTANKTQMYSLHVAEKFTRFYHYHTQSNYDCVGNFPTGEICDSAERALSLAKSYITMLSTVNMSSLGHGECKGMGCALTNFDTFPAVTNKFVMGKHFLGEPVVITMRVHDKDVKANGKLLSDNTALIKIDSAMKKEGFGTEYPFIDAFHWNFTKSQITFKDDKDPTTTTEASMPVGVWTT